MHFISAIVQGVIYVWMLEAPCHCLPRWLHHDDLPSRAFLIPSKGLVLQLTKVVLFPA